MVPFYRIPFSPARTLAQNDDSFSQNNGFSGRKTSYDKSRCQNLEDGREWPIHEQYWSSQSGATLSRWQVNIGSGGEEEEGGSGKSRKSLT
jgi:hypothetical protein